MREDRAAGKAAGKAASETHLFSESVHKQGHGVSEKNARALLLPLPHAQTSQQS